MLTPVLVILSLAYAACCWFGYMPKFLRPYSSDDPKKVLRREERDGEDEHH